jgi:thioredoxin reductase
VQAVRLGLTVDLLDRRGRAGGLVGNAWRIENHPGLLGPVSGREYVRRLDSMLGRFGIAVRRYEVASADTAGEMVVLTSSDGSVEVVRAAVLATGTLPVSAGFEGEGCRGVLTEVAGLLDGPAGRYAVVGGGEAALDYALSLAGVGCDVLVLVRSAELAASGRLPQAAAACGDIRIMMRTVVRIVSEDPAGGVVLECASPGGRLVESLDGVVVAVGRQPALPRLPGRAAVAGQGPVERLPGVFCAGDAALGGLGQACTAAGGGLMAARMAYDHLRLRGRREHGEDG